MNSEAHTVHGRHLANVGVKCRDQITDLKQDLRFGFGHSQIYFRYWS